jgi:hypothetical protein
LQFDVEPTNLLCTNRHPSIHHLSILNVTKVSVKSCLRETILILDFVLSEVSNLSPRSM